MSLPLSSICMPDISSNFYRHLLRGNKNHLRRHLVEHFDYVVVSQKLWCYLHFWYSSDYAIARLVRRDKFTQVKHLDLYPGNQALSQFLYLWFRGQWWRGGGDWAGRDIWSQLINLSNKDLCRYIINLTLSILLSKIKTHSFFSSSGLASTTGCAWCSTMG